MSLRVLMISPELPWPATGGGLVRIAALQRGLGRRADVTLLAPVPAGEEGRALELAEATGTRVVAVPVARGALRRRRLAAPLSTRPYHAAAHSFPALRRRAAELLGSGDFDVLYVHMLYGLESLPRNVHVPVVVDPQNVDREYWERKVEQADGPLLRAYLRRNLRLTVRYEERALPRLAAYVAVSRRDAELAARYIGEAGPRILVVPNGVDRGAGEADAHRQSRSDAVEELRVGFLGSMDLSLNVRAALRLCLEIRPLVQSRLPGRRIRWQIIGRNPVPAVRQLALRFDDVDVTGTVPDVGDYLRRLDLLAVPLDEGAGTKLRVLEAMGAGVPIVGSDYALQGIDGLLEGRNVRWASTPEHFAEVIAELLGKPAERHALAQDARRLALEHYEWDAITRRLAADLTELTDQWKPRKPATV